MTTASAARTGVAGLPRSAVIGLAVGALVLLAALLDDRPGRAGPPLDPRSDGPLGTSALVTLLERLDADVTLTVGLPGPADDVALLLHDRLDDDQASELMGWVRAGGTLVVTDPGSPFTPSHASSGLLSDTAPVSPGTCTVAALESVGVIDAGAPVNYNTAGVDGFCFTAPDGRAFLVTSEHGRGELVAVGGAAFVTNDRLAERDNAVLAAALLAPTPGTSVRFVAAPLPAGGGGKTLGDLVPSGLQRGLVQLAIAFAFYSLWRAIRLGRPVPEEQPVDIAGSELVSAVGRLLTRTRAPGAAAETLREDLRRTLRLRFGAPPTADPAALAAVVAARTGVDSATILAAVDDRPVTNDIELVAVARAVSSIHQEVLR